MGTSDFIQEIGWLVYLPDMLNVIYSYVNSEPFLRYILNCRICRTVVFIKIGVLEISKHSQGSNHVEFHICFNCATVILHEISQSSQSIFSVKATGLFNYI